MESVHKQYTKVFIEEGERDPTRGLDQGAPNFAFFGNMREMGLP